jgi:hypothetical protein
MSNEIYTKQGLWLLWFALMVSCLLQFQVVEHAGGFWGITACSTFFLFGFRTLLDHSRLNLIAAFGETHRNPTLYYVLKIAVTVSKEMHMLRDSFSCDLSEWLEFSLVGFISSRSFFKEVNHYSFFTWHCAITFPIQDGSHARQS